MKINRSKFFRGLAGLLLATLPLANCEKQAPPQVEIPKGVFVQKIVYTKWKMFISPDPPTLCVADLYKDGSTFALYNHRELTEGIAPFLSADQTWVAYLLVKNGITLMRIDVDGTGLRPIPFPLASTHVPQDIAISPDGRALLFSFNRIRDFDGQHIAIMNTDGSNFRIVYADSSKSFTPTWSHDGKRIYFAWLDWKNRFGHNPPTGDRVRSYIVSVNADGADWRAVSDTVDGLAADHWPAVSPEGSFIGFESQRTTFPNEIRPEIFLMRSDGTDVRRLTNAIASPRHGDHYDYYTMDGRPLWMKDGEHILFQREYYTYNHDRGAYNRELKDLYIIKADGTGMQKLTDDGISTLSK